MIDLPQPGLLFSIMMWVIMIGVLVTVHEFGHYIVGRIFGVKALTFSVGFGRELFGVTDKTGTRWKLSALPLGGYVKFLGDMDAASRPGALDSIPAEIRNQAFPSKPMWQRALIILAGPVINLLFAFLLFWGLLYATGVPYSDPVISEIAENSAASRAGLLPGDRIIEINERKIKDFDEVYEMIAPNANRELAMVVLRRGTQQKIGIIPGAYPLKDRFGNITNIGTLGAVQLFLPIVENVMPNSAAANAGILPGDHIRKIGDTEIISFPDVIRYLKDKPNQESTILVERENKLIKLPIRFGTRKITDDKGVMMTVGSLGVRAQEQAMRKLSFFATLPEALRYGVRQIDFAITGVGRMVTGQVSLNEVGGPLKIGEMAGQAASLGPDYFIRLMAMISISLGIMNLLPIPMLDGGHLALYAAEAVRGKPLNPKVLEVAFSAGFSLLIGFMVFLFWNDLRMFGVWRTIAGLWS